MKKFLFAFLIFLSTVPVLAATQTALFAGGCFWCMTPPFEKLEGVLKVTAGYTDGKGVNPTYDDYAERGFVESVKVDYDPSKITYPELLDVFWRQINPTDPGGQFVDRGPQYRSAVYFLDPAQEKMAKVSKEALEKSGKFDKPILTPILKATAFFPAEDYHQDYYKKSPLYYGLYRHNAGRDSFLDRVWGKKNH